MSIEVSIERAEAEFDELIARAEAGERIVILRDGRPVACLGLPPPGFFECGDADDPAEA